MRRWFVCIFAALLLCGCTALAPSAAAGAPSSPTPASSPTESMVASTASPTPDNDDLKALLPGKAGFEWHYFGFAEYGMSMTLKSITGSNGAFTYAAQGMVADLSGGAAKGDFNVKVTYQVKPGVLSMQLVGPKAMDNTFTSLELIRTPLAKGTQWTQTARDSGGKTVNLACTINDIKAVNGRKVYFVTYQEAGSDYYENREITEGQGVTAFYKLYKYDTGSDLIGYRQYLQDTATLTASYEQWLPKLGQQYTFFGLAEYGHKGTLVQIANTDTGDIYEYRGQYADGSGHDDKFVIRYFADLSRGTVTEQVVSSERGQPEVNSKLHNLVILKFPLSAGARWSHQATLNGKAVTVQATITDYDEAKGIVKVQYLTSGAAGYYNDTYIEKRTFEKGYGMTAFGCLLPGDIGISAADAKDPAKLADAINQHMFGYSMNKTLVQ